MARVFITFDEVIDINHSLEDQGLPFKLHLRDACGSQSFHVESIAETSQEEAGAMKQMITQYFKERRIVIKFMGEKFMEEEKQYFVEFIIIS